MSIFRMKQGDRRPYYENTVLLGGNPVDLTGTLAVTLRVSDKGNLIGQFVCTPDPDQVTLATRGRYTYGWLEGDMDVAGRFQAVTHVVFADGSDQTFPTVGFDSLVVEGNI